MSSAQATPYYISNYYPGTFSGPNAKVAPLTTANGAAPAAGSKPPAAVTSVAVPRTYREYSGESASSIVVRKTAMDDGQGNLPTNQGGTVNYTTGSLRFYPRDPHYFQQWNSSRTSGGSKTWSEGSSTDTWANGALVRVTYRPASVVPTEAAETVPAQTVRIDLTPYTGDGVMPGSIMFRFAGSTYVDRLGILYRDVSAATGSGIVAGAVDYSTGVVVVSDWTPGTAPAFELISLLTVRGHWTDTACEFRTPLAPLKPESVTLTAVATDGTPITASTDEDGNFVGALVRGQSNYQFGTHWVEFGQMVGGVWVEKEIDPRSIRYNGVAYSWLPLDAAIIGIDAVRLPPDGKVPVFRKGDVVIAMHTAETAPTVVPEGGGTVSCGRTRIGWVRVIDGNGATVTTGYTLDRGNGVVTFAAGHGVAQPVVVRHTVSDMRLAQDVQIDGSIRLSRPLSHDFPAGESIIASALLHGDRRARVSATWDQATWDGTTWADSFSGTPAAATLNLIDHPITVTNEGCDTDRWALKWLNTTTAELYSEKRGLVWSGSYTPGGADIAPINPRTRGADGQGGVPYLVIPGAANGGGWSAGNVVRINTVGAIVDMWVIQAIQQSEEPAGDGADGTELYCLGNIDRP